MNLEWTLVMICDSRSPRRSAGEALQTVVGRVLVCLASRGYGEGSIDEPINGASYVHNKLPDVHELARQLSDYVDADQGLVGNSENEFHESVRNSRDPSLGVGAERAPPDFIVDSLAVGLLLRESHPRNLGNRENVGRPMAIGSFLNSKPNA